MFAKQHASAGDSKPPWTVNQKQLSNTNIPKNFKVPTYPIIYMSLHTHKVHTSTTFSKSWHTQSFSMSYYMSIYLFISLSFIVVDVFDKQHCCSKWTALKFCCRLMSKIFIHVLICIYSIVDMSIIHCCWNILDSINLQQNFKAVYFVLQCCLSNTSTTMNDINGYIDL